MREAKIPAVIVVAAAAAALYSWAVVGLTPSHPGAIGLNMNALGTDWMVFYSGPQWFFSGHLAGLFNGDRFTDYLNSAFSTWLSKPIEFRPWVYPPTYLLAMLPFGLLPFVVSYVAFQLLTGVLLAAALSFGAERPRGRGLVVAIALVGPATAYNFAIGQNALLTAALLIGGLRLSRSRPVFGGAVLGLLTMKPQFWLLVPLALAGGRQWKALASSLLAAVVFALASVAAFGIDSWRQWFDLARNYANPHGEWVELGRMWGDSIYACLVSSGAPQIVANAVQAAGAILAAALAYVAFRRPLPHDRKIAILLAATVLAAPHSSLSDTVWLAIAVALWSAEATPGETSLAQWTLALALWLAPIFNPPVLSAAGRFTPLLILGFIAMVLMAACRRADNAAEAATPLRAPRRPAAEPT